jgi:hypothetical protein
MLRGGTEAATNGEIPSDIARLLLKHSPEYRELIKQRVHEARKRQWLKDRAIQRYLDEWVLVNGRPDVDLLTEKYGREIEGCG